VTGSSQILLSKPSFKITPKGNWLVK